MSLITKGLASGRSRQLGHPADVPRLDCLDRILLPAPYEVERADALLLGVVLNDARLPGHSASYYEYP